MCFVSQVDQLRSELMQERSARHDLEMDKSALERQVHTYNLVMNKSGSERQGHTNKVKSYSTHVHDLEMDENVFFKRIQQWCIGCVFIAFVKRYFHTCSTYNGLSL